MSPQVFRFCRSKCHKNFNLKRNPRKTKWTKAFRKSRGKEMTVDSTLDFEKRRNVPVKYDRNLMGATIRAMKRVQEIKSKREQRFFDKRSVFAGICVQRSTVGGCRAQWRGCGCRGGGSSAGGGGGGNTVAVATAVASAGPLAVAEALAVALALALALAAVWLLRWLQSWLSRWQSRWYHVPLLQVAEAAAAQRPVLSTWLSHSLRSTIHHRSSSRTIQLTLLLSLFPFL